MTGRFQPRPIRPTEITTINGWRLKRYEITLNGDPIANEINRAVDQTLTGALPPVPDGEHGIGFLVIHRGELALWVLADLWTGDTISQHTFNAPLNNPTALTAVPAGGPTACVFELAVHTHESNALINHILDPAPGPDVDGYLNDTLQHPS